MGTVVGTRAGFEPAVGRLTGACVAASPPWYLEPLDRLERSSPGYGPGTSPSTLERQCTAAAAPDGKLGTLRGFPDPPATDSARQAELRPRETPTCRRATRGLPARFALMLLERLLPSSRSTGSRLIKPVLFETLAPCEARFTRAAPRGRPRCRDRNRTDGGRLMRPAWVPAPTLQKNY